MDELKKMILDYVTREYLEEDDDRVITDDTPLISGGIVDSFSMVSLKRFLEKKYSIQIPDAEATPEAFDTVNSIAALVRALHRQVTLGRRVMAYSDARRESPTRHELAAIRKARASSRRSASSTRRRAPTSRSSSRSARRRKKVINLCANNYLGLSSHPDVVEAAHAGPRPPRLRHVVGALHLRHPGHPPRAREQAHRVPRHRGHAALPVLHGRQRRRLRGAC